MLSAEQFMAGSKQLATAARVREEHAKFARVPFDRAMYAQAAEQLHGWALDLERWSRMAADNDGHHAHAELEVFSLTAERMLAQLRHNGAEETRDTS